MRRETWALEANGAPQEFSGFYSVELDVFDPSSETSRTRFITFLSAG